jgi:hypothetical protein
VYSIFIDGSVENHLLYPAYVPIKRHVKIKSEANPYDPAWEGYFEKRLGVKMVHHLKGKRQLIALWKEGAYSADATRTAM